MHCLHFTNLSVNSILSKVDEITNAAAIERNKIKFDNKVVSSKP